eukprot:gene32984-42679_t
MIPLVTVTRIQHEKGEKSIDSQWSPKLNGDLREGDPLLTTFTIEGRAEVRELGGHLRLFLRNIKVTKRPVQITDKLRDEFRKRYQEEKKDTVNLNFDGSSDAADEEEAAVNEMIEKEKLSPVSIPSLKVFLTEKKAKSRMVDAHKAGIQIQMNAGSIGQFQLQENKLSQFEGVIRDIPESVVLSMQGLAILKLPQDPPVTTEPIIFAFAKLESARNIKIRSAEALQLQSTKDKLSGILEVQDKDKKQQSKADLRIKPLSLYRSLASKAFAALGLAADEEVDFQLCCRLFDEAEIFLIQTQVRRLFDVMDLNKTGRIGILDLENMLIAYDVLDLAHVGTDLVVLDVFQSFKTSSAELQFQRELKKQQQREKDPGQDAKKEKDEESDDDSKAKGKDKKKNTNDDDEEEVVVEGLDYSSFCEALQMLGVKQRDPEVLKEAFCSGGGVNAELANTKFLNLEEFRKAFLLVADLPQELQRRKMKVETGIFGASRNRDRLSRAMKDVEEAYAIGLKQALHFIETVKIDRRQKKDERRREAESYREQLQHEARRFQALRGQEKRLQLKREQEEKAKKRVESKVLKNQLQLRQQEAQEQKQRDIQQLRQQGEVKRLAMIREQGLDKMDLSLRALRTVPTDIYTSVDSQTRLTYLVYLDLSNNLLEGIPNELCYWLGGLKQLKLARNRLKSIPADLGTYMASLQILELEGNLLKEIPATLGGLGQLRRLDISSNSLLDLPDSFLGCGELRQLCVHSNKLTYIPPSIGSGCLKLEHLDVSRNHLETLSEELRKLIDLTYLDASFNRLPLIPRDIGDCTRLRYLDVSRNQLTTLPESFRNLTSLESCNLEHNLIKIEDAKPNISLVSKLDSKSGASQVNTALQKDTTINLWDGLILLKSLKLAYNRMHTLGLGSMAGRVGSGGFFSLTALDMSNNQVTHLPAEVGLLQQLIHMNLRGNSLNLLPPEVGSFSALCTLDLSCNKLKDLPEMIGQVTSLKELDLSDNPDLSRLPRSFIGLVKLRDLKVARCQLTVLPDTISTLQALEFIDISSNRFHRFPIELNNVSSLRNLDVSSNRISLLPRNINTLEFLSSIDLSNNRLRALPVEFISMLESVPSVSIRHNPWTDLPAKWGKKYPARSGHAAVAGVPQHAAPAEHYALESGYSSSDVLSLLYCARSVYPLAEKLFHQLGAMYYSQRLGLQHFLNELQAKLALSWDDGCEELAKHIFFQSRTNGYFLTWCEVDLFQRDEKRQKKNKDGIHREEQVRLAHSRQEELQRQVSEQELHGERVREREEELGLGLGLLPRSASGGATLQKEVVRLALTQQLKEKEEKNSLRTKQRENNFRRLATQESVRLAELLQGDRSGRMEARERDRDKARATLFDNVSTTALKANPVD